MRLNMIELMHETTTHRFETCLEGEAGGCPDYRHQGTEGRPGSAIASFGRHHVGRNCPPAWSRSGLGASLAAAVSPKRQSPFCATKEMGWAATGLAELGRRTSLPGAVGRSTVAPSVVYRLLTRHRWRKVAPDTNHPQSHPAGQADGT